LVARLFADQLSTDLCVTPNAHVVGRISGVSRQLDVLIESRHDTDNSRRLIVDAKKKRRKVDVKDVEEFKGLMEDVLATHGYLVCPSGYTEAAEKRAQELISIRILPLDHLDNFDPSTWPSCLKPRCKKGKIFWDGYPVFFIRTVPASFLAENKVLELERLHFVGKCDCCGGFHIWCKTCGDFLYLPENDDDHCGTQCKCKPPWFWIASIEEDDDGNASAELHVCSADGTVRTVNRRSL
jgi:hypothetical protein